MSICQRKNGYVLKDCLLAVFVAKKHFPVFETVNILKKINKQTLVLCAMVIL